MDGRGKVLEIASVYNNTHVDAEQHRTDCNRLLAHQAQAYKQLLPLLTEGSLGIDGRRRGRSSQIGVNGK